VRKVLDTVAQQGAMATYKKVMNKLDSYTPLGYSLCGVVVEVGAGAGEFKVGQLVAAAGNDFALHAEYNWIPVNLCAAVPRGVAPEHAAFSTVGAIAMQGVRRAEPQLGETALVIGLGLVGQLVVRLLVAAGIRVVGLDMIEARCRLAEQAGAVVCAGPDDEGLAAVAASLDELTSGRGADHVFLAAGGSSNAPVEIAAKLARDRARVVDIGKTKLDLPWNAYYDKELDVRFSRSYGPGRYDDRYELEGIDYPAGYVRWTERRNIECFLDLLARKDLEVETLVSGTFPMSDAVSVYADLSSGALKAVGVLLSYPAPDPATLTPRPRPAASLVRATAAGVAKAPNGSGSKRMAIGFIGAGNYASSMLLPQLAQLPTAELVHVTTTKSLSAVNAQRRFGFTTASTSASAVLEDESLDAIFVVTRHATHADLVCRALETGKAVFGEKPLALTADELDRITEVVTKTGNDKLMVGFNRRFAPMLVKMKADFGPASSAAVTRYLVNAGPLAADSWYRNEGEGSRFTGEGGHFLDTLSWWADSLPEEVYAVGGGPDSDDVQVTVRFASGTSGVISYLTGGNVRFGKETLDANGGGRSARLDNFRKATVWSGRGHDTIRARGQDKGQRAELARFVEACLAGTPMPIPFESLAATTRATIAVRDSLLSGKPEQV
jgi:predicted dehydrogenase/threonine dehydrogenase-like Zn-dependent dehydrogenase